LTIITASVTADVATAAASNTIMYRILLYYSYGTFWIYNDIVTLSTQNLSISNTK